MLFILYSMSILEVFSLQKSKKSTAKINPESSECVFFAMPTAPCQGPLYLVERQAIEVTVKLLTGQNFPLEICTSKTIGDVKKRIQQLEGLAVEGQRLIFGGHQLKDEAKVNEYKIEAGNTIHLVMRTAVASTSSTSSPGTIGTCESRGACGLFNMGNTCYLNSTLQALSNTRALRQYYDEGHYKARSQSFKS